MLTGKFSGGYTLVEVLVAMTILAMTLTVIMRIFSSGLLSIGISADYAHAVLLAESRLAAATAGPFVPTETEGSDGAHFHWTTTVEEYPVELKGETSTLPVEAFRVTVVVEWRHANAMRHFDLSAIRLAAVD